MKQSNLAVIGGTGFSEMAQNPEKVETDYGDVQVSTLELGGKQVYFVPRHKEKEVPHLVNYRANIQALARLDVKTILAVSAAGRLSKNVRPGHLVAVGGFRTDGATGSRPSTYAEPGLLLHASMDTPFSPGLREMIYESMVEAQDKVKEIYAGSEDLEVGFHKNANYYNINGPQFLSESEEDLVRDQYENSIEIKERKLQGKIGEKERNDIKKVLDTYFSLIVGQTLVPEVKLVREMGMVYGAVGMCVDNSNFPGGKPVTHADGVMHAVVNTAKAAVVVLGNTVKRIPDDFHDPIAHEALRHSLDPKQVDFDRLIVSGRPRLADILRKKLEV